MAKHHRKSVLPERHHGLEEALLIPGDRAATGLEAGNTFDHLNLPMALDRALKSLFNKRD